MLREPCRQQRETKRHALETKQIFGTVRSFVAPFIRSCADTAIPHSHGHRLCPTSGAERPARKGHHSLVKVTHLTGRVMIVVT